MAEDIEIDWTNMTIEEMTAAGVGPNCTIALAQDLTPAQRAILKSIDAEAEEPVSHVH